MPPSTILCRSIVLPQPFLEHWYQDRRLAVLGFERNETPSLTISKRVSISAFADRPTTPLEPGRGHVKVELSWTQIFVCQGQNPRSIGSLYTQYRIPLAWQSLSVAQSPSPQPPQLKHTCWLLLILVAQSQAPARQADFWAAEHLVDVGWSNQSASVDDLLRVCVGLGITYECGRVCGRCGQLWPVSRNVIST